MWAVRDVASARQPLLRNRHVLRISDLDYELPPELVATEPARPRDAARLMVVPRRGGGAAGHMTVRDLSDVLQSGDLLVVNTTKVLPARFLGVRADSGGHAEGLFVAEAPAPADVPGVQLVWNVLIKARRAKPGVRFLLTDHAGHASDIALRLLGRAEAPAIAGEGTADGLSHDHNGWLAAVERGPGAEAGAGPLETAAILDRLGLTPLPPYIRQARKRGLEAAGAAATANGATDREDRASYQTVYADAGEGKSVAAPTAGLHFTPELLAELARRGIERADVTLHVGLGTFAPVETEFVEQHPMHAEWCRVPAATAAAIARCRGRGGRVIAVGTTSARTLESFTPEELGSGGELSRATRLLITPGHTWKNVDGLMTNFHLPRTTLLALVASLLDGGAPELMQHYREAVERRYRFFSFGDAMVVV
jgi:S-adenosylmethionine:tRNA ribosyltransferase-isomerase